MNNEITTDKNNLTSLELDAIGKVTESSKVYVLAKNSIKVALIDVIEARIDIYKLIVNCINASGENKKFHLDEAQLQTVAKFMHNYVLDRHKGMTIGEVKNAFNLGITGEYGHYVGYGVSTFSKFVKGYMESLKRSAAMKEWLKAQDEPATTNKPITEFLKQNTEILNNFFELITPELAKRIDTIYTFNDTIYHLPSIYDFIRKTYVVEFTPETKEKIIKDAKISYYNYIKKSGLPQHKKEQFDMVVQSVKDYSKDELMLIIDTYDKSGINITYDYHVKSEALKVVLLGIKAKGKRPENLKKLENF